MRLHKSKKAGRCAAVVSCQRPGPGLAGWPAAVPECQKHCLTGSQAHRPAAGHWPGQWTLAAEQKNHCTAALAGPLAGQWQFSVKTSLLLQVESAASGFSSFPEGEEKGEGKRRRRGRKVYLRVLLCGLPRAALWTVAPHRTPGVCTFCERYGWCGLAPFRAFFCSLLALRRGTGGP